jgi:hypothetical protein
MTRSTVAVAGALCPTATEAAGSAAAVRLAVER